MGGGAVSDARKFAGIGIKSCKETYSEEKLEPDTPRVLTNMKDGAMIQTNQRKTKYTVQRRAVS